MGASCAILSFLVATLKKETDDDKFKLTFTVFEIKIENQIGVVL